MGQGPRHPSFDPAHEEDHPTYDDQYSEPVDLDTFGSQLRSGQSTRSIATRHDFLPDDSVPLFLANSEDEFRSPRFGRTHKKGTSRLLKTAAFVVAATVATFAAVKNPFTVFANATASLMGTQESKPAAAAAPVATPANQMATATPATPAAVATPSLTSTAAAATPANPPSRDEIAIALRNAHQNLAPSEVQPPAAATQMAAVTPVATATPAVVASAPAAAPVVAAPPIRRLSADELANLMSRGKALLASGDIAPARLLLERAAEAGEASAALMVAQTYDPAVLGSQDSRNITADPAQARNWYQRAAQLGSSDAQRRLSQLQ